MGHIVTPLEKAFAIDHRSLTRGFAGVIAALKRDDWAEAVQEANRLNREGGAHIAFEERILYPIVRMALGEEYVGNLYDEHRIAINALRDLIQSPDPDSASPNRKQMLIDKLQTGLDHAVSCGTLLSHLTVLDKATQQHLLDELEKTRSEGRSILELKS